MDEKTLKLFKRVLASPDGPELLDYLKAASYGNYRTFKASDDTESLHYCRGFAVAIDTLVENFEKCGEKLQALESIELPQKWM